MSTCLLAVDTATEICGVALAIDGRVKAEFILSHGVTHTRSVLAAIDGLLNLNGMKPGDIDVYAVTLGPGSFTGLRIGISTVKGLSLATEKPMVGLSSLEVLAHQAPGESPLVCPVMDARRHEVYWTLYQRKGHELTSIMDERVGPVADIAARVNQPCCFIGNGVSSYQSKLGPLLEAQAQWANDECHGIRPSVLALLGWQRFSKGLISAPRTIEPVYLRKSDAELQQENSPVPNERAS